MAEATSTRKTLRRAVASELQMPFFRKFSAGELALDASSTTTHIIDAALNQKENYWSGHWFYDVATSEVSLIRAFSAASKAFELETALAATPTTGDKYEIHTMWNAIDIHNAINRAISIGSRIFPETIVDKTFVFCEDKMEYDLSGLAKKPFLILRAWAEKPSILIRGQAASGGASSLTISEASTTLSGVSAGYLISIYAGTGMNQVRIVSTVAGQQVNTSVAWTTAPDSTSKYAIWNPNQQRYDWNRLDIFYTDSDEFPDTLSLRTRLPYYYGMRMRLEYLYVGAELATDADTTVVPKEFVVDMACAILHGNKLGDTKVDRDLHFAENKRYSDMAQAYILNNAPRMPSSTIPSSEASTFMDNEDPLDWYGLR